MSSAEKFGKFIIFMLLTIITVGIYPLYFSITMWQECNSLLREIRDKLDK